MVDQMLKAEQKKLIIMRWASAVREHLPCNVGTGTFVAEEVNGLRQHLEQGKNKWKNGMEPGCTCCLRLDHFESVCIMMMSYPSANQT